jgi:hypothetical protein
MKSKITATLHIWYQDMGIANHDEAREAVKTVLFEMHHKCQEEMRMALEDMGAKNVELTVTVY